MPTTILPFNSCMHPYTKLVQLHVEKLPLGHVMQENLVNYHFATFHYVAASFLSLNSMRLRDNHAVTQLISFNINYHDFIPITMRLQLPPFCVFVKELWITINSPFFVTVQLQKSRHVIQMAVFNKCTHVIPYPTYMYTNPKPQERVFNICMNIEYHCVTRSASAMLDNCGCW